MRVLRIHNRYLIRGGEDESLEAEMRLLRERGHQVGLFLETNERLAAIGMLRAGLRTTWSRSSYLQLRRLLREYEYDLVHVHNFFPLLSPAVYYAAQYEGLPVVQTLHNYRLLCANGLFYRSGTVCEDCLGRGSPWPGVARGCYRQSRAATAAIAAMQWIHRLLGTWKKRVDVYVALTEFSRKKSVEGGLPPRRIVVKPHFVYPDPGIGQGRGGYALYAGRLSSEKGLRTLVAAWAFIGGRLPLKVVGDGPEAEWLGAVTRRQPGIDWLGRKPMAEVLTLMGEARFLLLPSVWYETFGRVAIEAFAKGTPVIASNIGAIAELVDHGRTGLLFRPGDADDLAQKVQWALDHPQELTAMRREARAEYEAKYTADRNYAMLMDIYRRAIESRK